jgi:rod shape-determining protein MreC
MLSIRRWCARHGFQLAIAGAVLGGAWILHQTQGAMIWEGYQFLSRPFQGEPTANVQARLTNARIAELEQRLVELDRQNQQLRKLLGDYESPQKSSLAAPIIGRSSDAWWQQVTLGRGSQEGIKEGFIVTGIGGLVGRVKAVTPHSSQVLLVSDPTSRVGAMVSRSRSMGLIEGKGSKVVAMRFFEKDPEVRPGDPVATSSVSRLFPSGIPIGRVQSVNLNRGPTPEVKIQLTAPINHLEWVWVHPFESK